jgi:ClpP class serine protease
VQSTLLHDRIRYHADKTKIPVWTFAEDVAASGGYWIMCAGDELFASACHERCVLCAVVV